jgi:hypothetical protein
MSIIGFSFDKEGFFDFNQDAKTKQDVTNNIKILQDESDYLKSLDRKIDSKYKEIGNNIVAYREIRNNMQMDNSGNTTKYNTIDIPDRTDMIKNTYDVRKEDINNILLQQNYIYILGSVTCATLLIASIMIGSSRE